MSPHPVRKVTVRLTDLDELFAQPQSPRPMSGMQELYDVLMLQTRFLQRPCRYHVTLELPAEQITPGLPDTLRPQIAQFCAGRAQERREDLFNLGGRSSDKSRDTQSTGNWLLAPTLLLGSLSTWLPNASLPIALQTLALVIATAFSIGVGWAALRMPGSFTPYDSQPLYQELRVYQLLIDAELTISER